MLIVANQTLETAWFWYIQQRFSNFIIIWKIIIWKITYLKNPFVWSSAIPNHYDFFSVHSKENKQIEKNFFQFKSFLS